MIGLIGTRAVERLGIFVALEQGWTVTSGSLAGSSKPDSFTIVTKVLRRMQSTAFDDAVDGRIDIN